jgi:hypothetical protein
VLYLPVIGLAHAVMPETLFGTAIAMLLFTITCLTIRPLEARSRLLVAAVMLLLNVAATIVKPHWLPAAVASSVALILLANRGQRRRLLGGLTLGLALASVCLMWPESRWERQDATGFTRVFGPRTLFCNSADLMHDYLASRGDDLSTQVREDLQQMLTPAARQQAAAEGWGMMGFNGDACTETRLVASRRSMPGSRGPRPGTTSEATSAPSQATPRTQSLASCASWRRSRSSHSWPRRAGTSSSSSLTP